jgi:hypothetical protein
MRGQIRVARKESADSFQTRLINKPKNVQFFYLIITLASHVSPIKQAAAKLSF